jgi:hypothetical protein
VNDRDEFVLGALIHREQQEKLEESRAEWEAQRADDLMGGRRFPTDAEMCAQWAAERAAVEGPAHEAHVAELARNKQQRGTAA